MLASRPLVILWIVLALALTAVPAAGYDLANLNARLNVDTYSGDPAVATVTFDPSAPVSEVVVWSEYCDFGPAWELEPGRWVAEGVPAHRCYIVDATVMVGSEGAAGPSADCPFVGLKKFYLKKDAYTDSYDPALGYSPETAGDEGHVCSNRSVKIGKDAYVHGDAWAGEKLPKETENVSGTVGLLETPIVPEPVDPGDAWTMNDNGAIPLTAHGRDPLDMDGALELEEEDTLDLPPGTYLFSKLKLGKESTLRISGPTVIYMDGDFKAGYGRIVNERQLPSDLRILSMGKKVELPKKDDADFYGHVYAPDAKVSRKNKEGGDFFGSILGHYVKLYGDGGYHAAMSAPMEPTPVDLRWWMDDVAF